MEHACKKTMRRNKKATSICSFRLQTGKLIYWHFKSDSHQQQKGEEGSVQG